MELTLTKMAERLHRNILKIIYFRIAANFMRPCKVLSEHELEVPVTATSASKRTTVRKTMTEDCLVSTRNAVVLNGGLDTLLASVHAGEEDARKARARLSLFFHFTPAVYLSDVFGLFRASKVIERPALLLSSHFSSGYYHFMYHDLLKLLGYRKEVLSGAIKVFVNRNLTPWQREMLEYFGFQDLDIEVLEPKATVRFTRLAMLYGLSDQFYLPNPNLLALMRRCAASKNLPSLNKTDQVIWISRSLARYRRITNEHDVVERLASETGKQVRAVNLEQLSFEEKASLFRRAAAVVGPHGAGLAHIVFMEPGTKVIEIAFPDVALQGPYRWIAEKSSLIYVSLPLTPSDYVDHVREDGRLNDGHLTFLVRELNS